jgi:hypothetical protein
MGAAHEHFLMKLSTLGRALANPENGARLELPRLGGDWMSQRFLASIANIDPARAQTATARTHLPQPCFERRNLGLVLFPTDDAPLQQRVRGTQMPTGRRHADPPGGFRRRHWRRGRIGKRALLDGQG